MNHARLSSLLVASALFAGHALAQEAMPPAAEPAPAAETTDATEATEAAPAAAPATDAAPAATADAAAPSVQATASGPFSAGVQAAIGAPEPGKAQVVFFRPSKFAGGAVKVQVREGETEYGKLSSGRYFVVNLEPGQHSFTVHSENKDVTTVELEAGETYFFEGSISMGVMVGHANLGPSDATKFEAALKKMKRI